MTQRRYSKFRGWRYYFWLFLGGEYFLSIGAYPMLHKPLIEIFEIPTKRNKIGELVLDNDIYQIVFDSRSDKLWFLSMATDYLLISTIDPSNDIYIDSFQDLLQFLGQLLTDSEAFPFTLNSLIIDDLSRFYFSKINPQALNELLLKIKNRFKCNILVLSWDYKFDRGYRNMTNKELSQLDQNISYLNLNLDFLYVHQSTIYKFVDNQYTALAIHN